MPKWTDYTIKTDPADKDEVMILDTAGKANKRLGLSVFSDWILNKLADKTFQRLETSNKTIIGAINALNDNCKMLTILGESKIVLRDSGKAKKYFESLTVDSFPHFWLVYSVRESEGTFFISKSTFILGTILYWSFDAPQMHMLRCQNSEWLDSDWKII